MGTTPILAIPFVEPTGIVADYPLADRAQAERLESLLSTRRRITGWLTPAAGWSLQTNQIDVVGCQVMFLIQATRTGAAIAIPATGDITNQVVGTFDTALYSFATYGPMQTFSVGRLAAWFIAGPNLQLGAVAAPGVSIATNEQLSCAGTGFLNAPPP